MHIGQDVDRVREQVFDLLVAKFQEAFSFPGVFEHLRTQGYVELVDVEPGRSGDYSISFEPIAFSLVQTNPERLIESFTSIASKWKHEKDIQDQLELRMVYVEEPSSGTVHVFRCTLGLPSHMPPLSLFDNTWSTRLKETLLHVAPIP